MPNLLECLLSGHHDTNSEAVKLFQKAQTNLTAKAKKSGMQLGGDDFGEEIERLIIEEELPQINLRDQATYDTLVERIGEWYVPFDEEGISANCMAISQVLSSRLEYFRELQREALEKCTTLLSGCEEYVEHLRGLVDQEVEKTQPPSQNGYARLGNKKMEKIQAQIEAVSDLIDGLKGDANPFIKLQNFQVAYKANKRTIESGNDSAAVIFKKVVDSIKYVFKGKARKVSGLWKTKGKELTDHVHAAVKPVKKI